jgi:hypothetical protein
VNVSKILIALRLKVFGYQVLYVKKISIDSMGFSAWLVLLIYGVILVYDHYK